MDFFLKNLEETLDAINKCIDKDVYVINTKRIRRCNNVKSNNRSKINFIWRSLKFLEKEGSILEKNGLNSPKTYKIKKKEPVNIPSFIAKVNKDR
ncbi:MAG: hypothetical protein ACFFAS_16155 [Promethearchaeota archaeon]